MLVFLWEPAAGSPALSHGLCQREGAITLLVKLKPVETLGGSAEKFSSQLFCTLFFTKMWTEVLKCGSFLLREEQPGGLSLLSHGVTLLGVCHCTSTSGHLLWKLSVKALNSCSLLASDQALLFSLS